jgi:hypothetical protein
MYVILNLLAYSVHITAELLDQNFMSVFESFKKSKGEYYQIFYAFCTRDEIKKLERIFELSGTGG